MFKDCYAKSSNFKLLKVGVVYPQGKKKITYLSNRSLEWLQAIIHQNVKQGIRTLILIKG